MNTRSISTLLCVTMALMASTVSIPAQDSTSLETPLPPYSEPRPVKSHGKAYVWMAAGTLLPLILASQLGDNAAVALIGTGGFLVGPSSGQFYAGSVGAGLFGAGMRTVGSVMIISAAMECFMVPDCDENNGKAALGATLFLGGLGYSVIDTWFAVNRANHRAARKQASALGFSPMIHRNGEGRFIPGIAARVTF
jgi:hypothetical protein